MKQTIRILIVLFGISCQLNGQSIIKTIEQALEKDSIAIEDIELGFERNIEVKSSNNRYHVFNIKRNRRGKQRSYYPKEYFILDREKNTTHKLETKKGFQHFYTYKFAKFYNSKLIVIYEIIMEPNFYLDEFNLNGKRTSSKKGICPGLHPCKCFDLESDYILWIEYLNGTAMVELLNLITNEKTPIAQLRYLTLSADNSFYNSPKIVLMHKDREIVVSNFIDPKPAKEKKYPIQPIKEYKIINDLMIFSF